MWNYSKKLMEHFMNPRNSGQLPNPDGRSEVGSPQCGDAMTLDIEVDDDDRITDVRFMTFGCAGAIASASALTEIVKGKTLDEALSVTNEMVVEYLGGMPEEKFHCSVMGHEALEGAVRDFKRKRNTVRKHLEAMFRDLSWDSAGVLGGTPPGIAHVHPSRVLLEFPGDPGEGAVEAVSRELSGRVGRTVEVKVKR